jgi:hypothetical protein
MEYKKKEFTEDKELYFHRQKYLKTACFFRVQQKRGKTRLKNG